MTDRGDLPVLSSEEEVRAEMCAVETQSYVPKDAAQFSIMVRHFRGAVVLDELEMDCDLFVSDLGFDAEDGKAAVELVAVEKGWK